MVRVHVLETSQFGVDERPIVVVDCSSEGSAFDDRHAKEQARKLKKQVDGAAVIVQHGAKFWVV